jgi:hypothetical protein
MILITESEENIVVNSTAHDIPLPFWDQRVHYRVPQKNKFDTGSHPDPVQSISRLDTPNYNIILSSTNKSTMLLLPQAFLFSLYYSYLQVSTISSVINRATIQFFSQVLSFVFELMLPSTRRYRECSFSLRLCNNNSASILHLCN